MRLHIGFGSIMPGAFDLSTHSGASKKDPFGPMQAVFNLLKDFKILFLILQT